MTDKELIKLLAERHYKPDYEPPPEHAILKIKESIVGTLGNFVVFSGLPKAGKTTFVGATIASSFLLQNHLFGISLNMASLQKKSVGYFDTESGQHDFYKNLKRIKEMATAQKLPDNFNAFSTRQDKAEVNRALIETYCKHFPASVIVIDGLLDLINNFNNEEESRFLIDWLKLLTYQYNVLIIGMIHLGKKDNHTLGHFGSMVDRYAQSVVEIVKDKENALFLLKAKYLRSDIDFKDVAIMWNGFEYVETVAPEPKKRR